MEREGDTIVALSSGRGRAGVGVIRLSGPKSFLIIEKLTRCALPKPRRAGLRNLYVSDQVFDEALVLTFSGPYSFTGENCAEIHCHGSPAIIEGLLAFAANFEGVRLAERGEFTRLAVENGKLDLLQAEGIQDIIDAQTPRQVEQAARSLTGESTGVIQDWRSDLIRASALLAASIDFADEGDVSDSVHAPVMEILDAVSKQLISALANSHRDQRVREGIRVAIIGEPNAGKSSLLNALLDREAAIVSSEAGTTRDIVEVPLVLGGLPVQLADTAGLRDTQDDIEREGVKRAQDWAAKADIVMSVRDGSTNSSFVEWSPSNKQTVIYVGNKSDLGIHPEIAQRDDEMTLSSKTGEGLEDLRNKLEEQVDTLSQTDEPGVLVRLRHRQAIERALECLGSAQSQLLHENDVDLAGFEVKQAISAMDGLIGRVDIEVVLDNLFSGFCIGK